MIEKKQQPKQKLYDLRDFMKITGLSRITVIKYQEKGLIPDNRNPINNYRYFTAEDINEFISKFKKKEK